MAVLAASDRAGERPAARPRKPYRWNRSAGRALGFIFPGYVFYLGFLLIPLALTVVLSFTTWDGYNWEQIQFSGVRNYAALLSDGVFLQALLHNLAFLVGSVVIKAGAALVFALFLRRAFPGSSVFQGVFLVPSTLSLVVVGILLTFMFDPDNGIINPLLRSVGLGGLAGTWLGDPSRALTVLILLDAWVGFGLYMYIFLSSMAALPGDVFEAAKVDGAKPWQETFFVMIPMLRDAIKLVLLLAAIESLKVFATIYVSTKGGPDHSTEVLSTWAYFEAFTGQQVGYGSAIACVLLIVTFVLAFFYVRQNRDERGLR